MTDIRTTFGRELERELNKIGFDLEGHYPLLKTMFYTLDVDFENTKVGIWYGPKQEKLASRKLSASDVVKELQKQHKLITEHGFTDEAFIRTLYDVVGGESSIPDVVSEYAKKTIRTLYDVVGGESSIPDVVSEYAARNVYGTKTKKTIRTFLSYDLYRLKTRIVDDMELSLVTATRAYTQRKSDFLWIPTNTRGRGMYISHIRFRRIRPSAADIKSRIDDAVKGS